MARNDQNFENAFQAAETGLEQALSQGRFDTLANTNLTQTVSSTEEVVTVIQFESASLVPDRAFSLGSGSGISAYHFNVIATAESKREGTSGNATDRGDCSARSHRRVRWS